MSASLREWWSSRDLGLNDEERSLSDFVLKEGIPKKSGIRCRKKLARRSVDWGVGVGVEGRGSLFTIVLYSSAIQQFLANGPKLHYN